MATFRQHLVALMALCLLLGACAGGEEPAAPAEGEAAGGGTEAGAATDPAPATGAETGGEEAPPEDVLDVSFGASALPSSIGLLAAIIRDQGLDAEHGLNMTFTEFAPDQAEQAILTGQVDTGFFPVVSLAQVRAEGQEVVFLRPLQANHGSLIVRADSEYESLEDLQGQTIATLNPVSGIYTSMQVLAAELGMDWEGDFELVSAPPPGLVAFIETGEVEAIVHFEPTVSALLATGEYRSVMSLNDAWQELTGAPLFMLGVAARQSWVDENPEAASRLAALFEDLLTQIAENPELLRDYQEELGLDDEAMDIAVEAMSGIYIPQGAEEIQDNVQLILERSLELGIIPEIPETVFVDV